MSYPTRNTPRPPRPPSMAFNRPGGVKSAPSPGGNALEYFFGAGRREATQGRPTKPYSTVGAVYTCVRAKADALVQMPLVISTGDDQVIESGPLVELVERPNPKMSGRAFLRMTSAHLDLFGRVHWHLTFNAVGGVVEVIPICPLQMRPVTDRAGELIGWRFMAVGKMRGREEFLPVEEVWTITDPNFEDPSMPFEGLSPRHAVAAAIAQYYKADLANESSLDNGVEPGGALQTDKMLTEDQRSELREEIRDHHRGVRNRRRFMVLEGGLKFEGMSANFKDMEFADLKRMTRTDICAGFNVPPAVVGFYEDSNYSHADAAESGFWVRTMLPRAAWIAEEFTAAVLGRFAQDRSLGVANAARRTVAMPAAKSRAFLGAQQKARRTGGHRFYAWFDPSGIPSVQAAQLQLAEQATKWNQMGVPLNQILAATDAPFQAVPWGDTWYKPVGMIDVREDATITDDPAGSTDETGLIPAPGSAPGSGPSTSGGASGGGGQEGLGRSAGLTAEQRATEAQKAALWELWRRSWAGLERSAWSKVKRHFAELRAGVLARLHEESPIAPGRSLGADEQRDVIGSVLFDLVDANKGLLVKAGPLIREAYRLGGEQSMQEAADAKGQDAAAAFNVEDPRVKQKLRQREIQLTETNRTLRRRLAQTLTEGLDAQETLDQVAERVRHEFGIATNRARTIARTEVGAAVEDARHEGRDQAGVPLKSWLWSRREHGRRNHGFTEAETAAHPIPQADDFTISGSGVRCPYPRAAGLPASESVNCGCTALSRFPNDSLKSVLKRYAVRGFLTYDQLVARDHADPQEDDQDAQ